MSDRGGRARTTLEAAGFNPDELAAESPQVAPWLARLPLADGPQLLAALGDLGTPGAAALLAALEPQVTAAALRRAVRGALFLLKQRGIVPPATTTPAATPPPRLRASDWEGYLTAFDGRGDRIGWLLHTPAGGATTLVIAVFNEPEGLRDVRATSVTRTQVRTARERFSRDNHLRLVAVDGRLLDALLVEAHDRLATRERAQDYRRIRQKLTTAPPAPASEPQSTRVAPPDMELALAALPRSTELLAEPEFAGWWPAAAVLAPFATQIRELRDSPIVLAPGPQEQRLRGIIDAAAQALFPVPVLARRLAGTAFVLAETGRDTAATLALAIVRALGTAPATVEVPLITTILHRALGTTLAAQEAERRRDDAPPLIVTPGEALRDRGPSRPPHTRG